MTQFGCVLPYFPPAEMIGVGSKFYEDVGVDFGVAADQHNFIIPRSICTPDIIPSVGGHFDLDMWMDSFLVVSAAAQATERLQVSLMCDTRRPPANIAQMVLTLDHLSHGRFHLYLGAGEVKQWTPYGIERKKPFTRLEECLRIVSLLLRNTGPVDHDGPIWTLRKAVLRLEPYEPSRPPKVVVLGGPGRSVEIAERGIREGFADGWATWFPPCGDLDWYAASIATLRSAAESADRDPDDLVFTCLMATVIYGDESERDWYLENLAIRLHSALEVPGGGACWDRWGAGQPHPLGDDFFYARDFIPMEWSREDAIRVAEAVPPELVARAKFCGTPEQVAAQVHPYLEAGATHCLLGNFVDLLSSGDFADAIERQNRVTDTFAHLRKMGVNHAR